MKTSALPLSHKRMTKVSFTLHSRFILNRFTVDEMNVGSLNAMKIKNIIGTALAATLLAGCVSEKQEESNKEATQAKLMAQAKVSKEDAQATALAQVPNGTVKESELEKEHGKLIWSFDVATPGTKNITEVNVDAINGQFVSKDIETPKDEGKEKDEKD